MGSENGAKGRGIVAISSGASESPSAGHFYWHYLGLVHHRLVPDGVCFQLIGSRALHDPASIPLFSTYAHRRRFRVGLLTIWDYRFLSVRRKIRELQRGGSGASYIYEGSLADLALVLFLAPSSPNSVFLFNFFWPQDWEHMLNHGNIARRLLTRALRGAPSNILFTADTPKFAKFLATKLELEVEAFPAFSPFGFPQEATALPRKFDLLVVFKRHNEFEFAKELIKKISQKRQLSVAFHGPIAIASAEAIPFANPQPVVEFFPDNLEPEAYVGLLASSSVALIAYSKRHYEFGSSGKLLDAHEAGCAVLIPRNSGLHSQAEELKLHSVHSFVTGDVDSAAEQALMLMQKSRRDRQQRHDFSKFLTHFFGFQDRHDVGTNYGRHRHISQKNWWIVVLIVGLLNRPALPAWEKWYSSALRLFRLTAIQLVRWLRSLPLNGTRN